MRTRNLPWYPRRGSRDDLAKMFSGLGFSRGVEVGTRFGGYAETLVRSNQGLTLTCVDPWEAYNNRTQEWQDASYSKAVERLGRFIADGRLEICRKKSMDAVGLFSEQSLDFVFIDGNHDFDYAIEDIIHWSKRVRSGGVVAVHDYHPFCGSDVRYAVDAYVASHDIRPWYVTREMEPTAFWVKA